MEHISDQILAYLENRLDAETRIQFEQHLDECDACLGEVAATRSVIGTLTLAGRAAQSLPINSARHWASIRERWRSPLTAGARMARGVHAMSRLWSWQLAVSALVVMMALASGATLSNARAAGPTIPYIQTPGTRSALTSDTPTLAVTYALDVAHTPTLTLTPIPNDSN